MDVFDPLEHELGVWVERLRFVSLAPRSVGHGIDLRPSVDDK